MKRLSIILMISLMLCGCAKDENEQTTSDVHKFIVYQDEPAESVFDVVVKGDLALCFYLSNGIYKMRMMDQDGSELWTRDIGHGIGDFIDGRTLHLEKVLIDRSNQSFAIFFGNRLLKINDEGEEVYFNENFLNLDGYQKLDVFQDAENNFIIVGTRSHRCFIAKYSQNGDELFRNIYFVSLPGINAFTSGVSLEDGGYLIAGTKESVEEDTQNTMIIAKVRVDGSFEWVKLNEIGPAQMLNPNFDGANVFGRELIPLDNGHFIYVLNTSQLSDPIQNVNVHTINSTGEILNTEIVNLARKNYAAGISNSIGAFATQRGVGHGFSRNGVGGYTGIINSEINFLVASETAELGNSTAYYYRVNNTGSLEEMKFVNQRSAMRLASVGSFKNGNSIAVGVSLSFGATPRLTVILL